MTTYAEVEKTAKTTLHPWTDSTTPHGVFGATAEILGLVTTYFFTGTIGDPGATVVGRIEQAPDRRQNHYIGDHLKGGMWVGPGSFPVLLATASGNA